MAQLFRPGADSIARCVLIAIAVAPFAYVAVTYAVVLSPEVTGQNITITQPVPFSHKHHVGGLGLDCRFCHTGVENSAVAGLPATETCMTCHSQIWTQAEMLAPVRASFERGVPLRWERIDRLPDYVYFDHSIHIAKGVGCTTCHDAVNEMPLMRQSAPLTMAWCLDCHRDPAPSLRPNEAIFSTSWAPPADQRDRGKALLAENGIDVAHLADCSVCHR
ncbi:MAG: cytochrome c3 family protein [Hyphomicrobiales bacterium]|nr:cytochrome c3 family protein [Hyphomicrobiales bacterium]MBV9589322.1 cytochrome c3 family protein [Hyphomicrobiales bacterium]